MAPRRDEERELQTLLRNVAGVVLLCLFALIVIVALVTPFLTERSADTTLLLGLAAAIMGTMPVLFGVQIALNRGNGKPKDGDGA